MARLRATEILRGSILVEGTQAGNILFGVPLEVVKRFLQLGLSVPRILVKPERALVRGIPQFAVEYPLYYNLFVLGNTGREKRLQLVCDAADQQPISEALRHTLLGPNAEDYRRYALEPRIAQQLLRESHYFALKSAAGVPLGTPDLVRFHCYNEQRQVELDEGVIIQRLEDQAFLIIDPQAGELTVHLGFGTQTPPLPLYDPQRVDEAPTFGYRVLGSLSGFDPKGYTTGYLLYINGVPVLVDGPAWLDEHLLRWGVEHNEIYAHIVTHCHDDHAGCFASTVMRQRKITLLTTREIAESLVVKLLGSGDGLSAEDIRTFISFQYVDAALDARAAPFRFLGADWRFHYSVHSIPCIGFEVSIGDASLFISGDSASLSRLRVMRDEAILDERRYRYVVQELSTPRTVRLIDGGGGEIHFDPREFSPSRDLYFGHVSSELLVTSGYQLLRTGDTQDLIVAERHTVETIQAVADALEQFKVPLGDPWKRILFAQGRALALKESHPVVVQGEEADDVYFVLKGRVRVFVDGELRAEMGAGWFFGEQGVLGNTARNATIITASNTLLFAIPGQIFREFVDTHQLSSAFETVTDRRASFLSVAELRDLPAERQIALSQHATKRRFVAGSVIAREGSPGHDLFIITHGSVRIERNGELIAMVRENQLVGERAVSSSTRVRNADIIADEDVELLAINGQQFLEVLKDCPLAEYKLALLYRSRS
ncbi:MAG: cyclic nucleotide-binding domain-containing protein [Candidatus Tectomicrobia bacterium]|nr:cyclic nucleotide-binding domain-containing protein [Candidatus Tectomicrobia bacterium]